MKQVELRYIIGERFCYHNSIASYPGSWWGGPTVGLFGKSLESSEDFSMRCQCLVSNLLRRYVGKCGEYVVVKVRRSPASRVGSGYETSHTRLILKHVLYQGIVRACIYGDYYR